MVKAGASTATKIITKSRAFLEGLGTSLPAAAEAANTRSARDLEGVSRAAAPHLIQPRLLSKHWGPPQGAAREEGSRIPGAAEALDGGADLRLAAPPPPQTQ